MHLEENHMLLQDSLKIPNYMKLDDIIKKIMSDNSAKVFADMDDTLFQVTNFFLKHINKRLGTKIKMDEWVSYNVENLNPVKNILKEYSESARGEIICNILKEHVGEDPEFWKLSLYDGSSDVVSYFQRKDSLLANARGSFYIGTAREKYYHDSKARTIKMLIDAFKSEGVIIDEKNILFNGDKAKLAQENNGKLFFEDHARKNLDIAHAGIPSILFNKPHNILNNYDKEYLDAKEYMNKYSLLQEVANYEGELIFRFDSMRQFADYLGKIKI